MVSSSQALSVNLSTASRPISKAAFKINKQIITEAIGSRIGNPSLAPKIPIKLPTDDKASER